MYLGSLITTVFVLYYSVYCVSEAGSGASLGKLPEPGSGDRVKESRE